MTNYAAYDAGLPCRNTACRSHGMPHPNCRCWGNLPESGTSSTLMAQEGGREPAVHQTGAGMTYSSNSTAGPSPTMTQMSGSAPLGFFRRTAIRLGFAGGGEVPDDAQSVCEASMPHEKGCQYFVDGGTVADDPDWEIQPAAADTTATPASAAPSSEADWETQPDQPDEWEDETSHYSTPGQQIGAGLEGVAQGVAGPLAPMAESALLGIPTEDIAGRAAANPITHGVGEAAGLIGSMFTGVGEGALAMKAAEGVADMARFGQIGSGVLKGFISSGLIQGGDEISKAMLGQGDPEAPVASALVNMGAAGLLGGLMGGGAATTSVVSQKLVKNMGSFIAGFGQAAEQAGKGGEAGMITMSNMVDPAANQTAIKIGGQFYNAVLNKGIGAIPEAIGAAHGLQGYAMGKVLEKFINPFISKGVGKIVGPALLKTMTGTAPGISQLGQITDHAMQVANGNALISKAIASIFKVGGQQVVNAAATERQRQKLADYIAAGGINQNLRAQQAQDAVPTPQFAQGGVVAEPLPETSDVPVLKQNDAVQEHYPEQSLMLNAAKGRVSNYLSTLRPPDHPPRLAYDDMPDQRDQEREYNSALDIANDPLSIIDHIKAGTIEPSHIGHLNALYPEVNQYLAKKITQRITEGQAKKEAPPAYHVRQGLSMLLGTDLDSSMTPESVQAIQATFAPQQAARSPGTTSQANSANNKVQQQAMTPDQARQQREQREKP